MTVKKFAEKTGVSVRTLHYYDQIDLLKPDSVDEQTGYRYYSEPALRRMHEILFYRELDFSLHDIRELLASPYYDRQAALAAQAKLLRLKKERLERVIEAIERLAKGDSNMDFTVFDYEELDNYREEVVQRWGNTAAYRESSEKDTAPMALQEGLEAIIAAFAVLMQSGIPETDEKAQVLVARLQEFITETQYTCTNEILARLGELYVGDERFQKNIDKAGEGTAAYIHRAISIYCER